MFLLNSYWPLCNAASYKAQNVELSKLPFRLPGIKAYPILSLRLLVSFRCGSARLKLCEAVSHRLHIVDELALSRTELTWLEVNERRLVKLRAAAAVQKKRINEQIQKRPPFIQRLPVELLSPTLRFAVIGTNPSQEGEILARVWRRWRDVVLANPDFWFAIEIVGSQKSSPAARSHLKRSR